MRYRSLAKWQYLVLVLCAAPPIYVIYGTFCIGVYAEHVRATNSETLRRVAQASLIQKVYQNN